MCSYGTVTAPFQTRGWATLLGQLAITLITKSLPNISIWAHAQEVERKTPVMIAQRRSCPLPLLWHHGEMCIAAIWCVSKLLQCVWALSWQQNKTFSRDEWRAWWRGARKIIWKERTWLIANIDILKLEYGYYAILVHTFMYLGQERLSDMCFGEEATLIHNCNHGKSSGSNQAPWA